MFLRALCAFVVNLLLDVHQQIVLGGLGQKGGVIPSECEGA